MDEAYAIRRVFEMAATWAPIGKDYTALAFEAVAAYRAEVGQENPLGAQSLDELFCAIVGRSKVVDAAERAADIVLDAAPELGERLLTLAVDSARGLDASLVIDEGRDALRDHAEASSRICSFVHSAYRLRELPNAELHPSLIDEITLDDRG